MTTADINTHARIAGLSRMVVVGAYHPPRAKALAHAIRKHWSIENGQHWVLDIAFGEDTRRQQDRHGAANFAAVRRLAVSLLRQDKTLKRGAKCKRMACALNPNYLLHILRKAQIDA
jgi:hypothetical protein